MEGFKLRMCEVMEAVDGTLGGLVLVVVVVLVFEGEGEGGDACTS